MFNDRSLHFWSNWLVAVAVLSALMGLAIALTSAGTHLTMGLITRSPMELPPPSAAGDNLMHFFLGLAGGVMVGWALSLAGIAHYAFRRGERWAWVVIASSVAGWFLVDSTVSVTTGLTANVFGNIFFLILFEIPLAATYTRIVRRPLRENKVAA